MRKHLAIFSPEAVKQIFNGQKTVETRFSQKRIPPFGEVNSGDIVYIKPSGEEICGQFLVHKVISFENLDSADLQFLKNYFANTVSIGSPELDDAYFLSKLSARFGTIIFIDRVEHFIVPPVKITKKDQRGWVVLD